MFADREAPLYEIKANLFKGLAHPVRIRILEILAAAPGQSCPVSALLEGTGLEASHLSQHLATLRRHGVVTSARSANTVTYSLASPTVAELLASARKFLVESLAGARDRLEAAAGLPEFGASGPGSAPVGSAGAGS